MGSAEQSTRGLSLSHAAMRLLIILLMFLFASPRFDFHRMTGPKLSNSFQAALLFGATMIFPMVRTSNNLQLALTARGMRDISLVHGGCESSLFPDCGGSNVPPFMMSGNIDMFSCCPVRGRGCDDELCG